jgi:spore coat protein U-like protein
MRALALILSLILAAPTAWAGECSGPDGSVTVSVTPLTFNDYFASNPAPDIGNFTVNAACTGGSDSPVLPPLSVGLTTGSGNFGARTMANGAAILDYQIYSDETLINVWGDGAGSGAAVSTSGGSQSQAFTGYGKIFAGQWVTVGTYTDRVTVTITY